MRVEFSSSFGPAWPFVYFDRGDKIYTQVDTRFRLATQSKSIGPFIREILSVLAKPRSSQNWGVIYTTATNFKRLTRVVFCDCNFASVFSDRVMCILFISGVEPTLAAHNHLCWERDKK